MKSWSDFRDYEEQFRRATASRWAKPMKRDEFRALREALAEAGVRVPNGSASCQACVLRLLTVGGKWYFTEKEKAAAEARRLHKKRIT